MSKGPQRFKDSAGHALRKVVVWISGNPADVSTSPTITAGSGVPSSTEPNGSIWLRTDAADADNSLYQRIGGAWVAIKGQTA